MSWSDRDYNQSAYRDGGPGGFLFNLFFGSAPLGTFFGIRVRIHATLLWFMGLTILVPGIQGFEWKDRVGSMAILFGTVLLHEFGHCFAARWVGGSAEEILLWPLGGLAYTSPPHRWLPSLITTIGGPAVNVVICLICGAWLRISAGFVPWNPFDPLPAKYAYLLTPVTYWVWWVYFINLYLLLFNLLPIYPMDGGRMLQEILWPFIGYYKSMNFACVTGMVGAVALGVFGLIKLSFLLIFLALNGFFVCRQQRMALREMGPGEFGGDQFDYASSLREENAARAKANARAARAEEKRRREEQAEQQEVDAILEKVSQHGMHSLSWTEKRALKKATERQRQRDLERSRQRTMRT